MQSHKSSNHKLSKTTKSVLTQMYIKHTQTTNRRNRPCGIASVKKKHIRLGHADIVDHSVDLSIPDFFKVQKGMDRSKNFFYINA